MFSLRLIILGLSQLLMTDVVRICARGRPRATAGTQAPSNAGNLYSALRVTATSSKSRTSRQVLPSSGVNPCTKQRPPLDHVVSHWAVANEKHQMSTGHLLSPTISQHFDN